METMSPLVLPKTRAARKPSRDFAQVPTGADRDFLEHIVAERDEITAPTICDLKRAKMDQLRQHD